ncbi:MAG: hypothetical protein AB7H93_07465 [Vicinamibacterales bacterium]
MRTPLAADTTLEVEARQIEAWRRMSPAEKIAAVQQLSAASRVMMLAGIRHRHPDAGEREVFLRAAIILFGADLAVAAFPDAAAYVST